MGIKIYLAVMTLICGVCAIQHARRKWGERLAGYQELPPEKQALVDTDAYEHYLAITCGGGALVCATLLLSFLIDMSEPLLVILYSLSGAPIIWGLAGLIKLMIQDYKRGL